MTAARQEAIRMLEKVPEDKLGYVVQIIQGVNGLLGMPEMETKHEADLEQFVMQATERGQDADGYIREMRDNDRI